MCSISEILDRKGGGGGTGRIFRAWKSDGRGCVPPPDEGGGVAQSA